MQKSNDIQASGAHPAPEDRFFGRRKGQQLSAKRQHLLETLYPKLALDPADAKGTWTVDQIAPGKEKLWLEIGFGKGEHLYWQAKANPSVALIGCEPYLNGIAGLLDQLDQNPVDNIRLYADDARHIMAALADSSLDRLFLIHPDPWPKRRHARRRFVNPRMLNEIARLLQPGGEFRVATDHPIYREWTAIQMAHREDFEWTAEGPDDWQTRPVDWPATRYAEKALEGAATFMIYRRV